jgi:type IV secretory pathway TraG/TraD family ATPase VirD4
MLNGMIVGFFLACVTQNALGLSLAASFGPLNHEQQMVAEGIGIGAFIAAGGLCGYVVRRVFRRRTSSFWASTLGRWVIGRVAGAAVYGALVAVLWNPAIYAVAYLLAGVGSVAGVQAVAPLFLHVQVLIWIVALSAAWPLRTPVKERIGKASRPVRRLFRSLHMGRGGSSAFAGILEEWACRWKPGMVVLGASMFDRHWLVGIKDDRMLLTAAGNGSGKDRCSIIPNLLKYPGSIYCQDFKGQLAAVTAQARRDMGQSVHILDPMGVLMEKVSCFNPVAMLDPKARDYVEQIDAIVDALVIGGDDKNRFWDDAARTLISGLIDFVVRRDSDREFMPRVKDTEAEAVNA